MIHDHHEHEHQHELSYEDAIRLFRADKDETYRTFADSPIPAEQRPSFSGLTYY